ncbi:S-adenosylmethionine uptake transporter [Pacificibacter maritimus]|uniref:S-adenosylmethionine uptake transporter n=1 Tax=Pacificibacter maritimus TaxID=762213 RepID=A0A3N4TXU9_9RHOB|nr:DMT family transporter [Pacificibacter maritimus]RPE63262.1 S-adenosylmethionine uptake transporter [Pacificibacter maritimus]
MGNLNENMRGAILMMAAMAAFALNDAILKALVVNNAPLQVIFLRGCVTLILVYFVLSRITGPVSFRMSRRDAKWVAIRSVAETCASLGIIMALSQMPFANVSATLQSTPLLISVGAAIAFGVPLGWRRLLAIAIGFVGVLLIVKPGPEGFSNGVLWALLGVSSVTVRDLSVKAMSSDVNASTVTFFAILCTTVIFGLSCIGGDWGVWSPRDLFLLVLVACAIIAAYALSVIVMKVGDISFVAPYRYTALIWALLIGFFVFNETPDIWTFLGAGVIAVTGVYTLIGERRMTRQIQTDLR